MEEEKPKKEKEATSFSLSNPSRVTPPQGRFISLQPSQRYVPVSMVHLAGGTILHCIVLLIRDDSPYPTPSFSSNSLISTSFPYTSVHSSYFLSRWHDMTVTVGAVGRPPLGIIMLSDTQSSLPEEVTRGKGTHIAVLGGIWLFDGTCWDQYLSVQVFYSPRLTVFDCLSLCLMWLPLPSIVCTQVQHCAMSVPNRCLSVCLSAYMKSQHWVISDHWETNSTTSTLPYHKTPPPRSSSHTYVRTSGESVLRNGRRSRSTCTVWVVRRPGYLNRNKDYRTNSDLILWFKFCTVERLEEINWLTLIQKCVVSIWYENEYLTRHCCWNCFYKQSKPRCVSDKEERREEKTLLTANWTFSLSLSFTIFLILLYQHKK